MRRLCKGLFWVALAGAGIWPAVAALGSGGTVYTWVDRHGVRHYADVPQARDAKRLDLQALAVTRMAAAGTHPLAAPAATRAKPVPVNPRVEAERRKYCRGLRADIAKLEYARRIQLREKGKTRYLSGAQIGRYRAKLRRQLARYCAQ